MKHKIRFSGNPLLLLANRRQKRRKQKVKKNDKLKLRVETLEDRLPVSSTFLSLAAAAVLGEGMAHDSNIASAEYSSEYFNASPTSLSFQPTAMETALLADPLNAFQVDRVFDEDTQSTGKASPSETSLDFAAETTVFATDFQSDSTVDLMKQFGDDVFYTQISTLNFSQMPAAVSSDVAAPVAQAVSFATSSGGGVSNSDAVTTVAQSTSPQANIPAETSTGMGLTISDEVPENGAALDPECCDSHDDHSYLDALAAQESATGYLPNVPADDDDGPMYSPNCCGGPTTISHAGSSCGGVCNTCENVIFHNADSTNRQYTIDPANLFASGGCIATYSISGGDGLTIQPDGSRFQITVPPNTVDTWSFTITASCGTTSSSMEIDVCSVRVVGYMIEERAWGDTWKPVEDRDKTDVPLPGGGVTEAGLWQVLWQENEYRWQPILENGVGEEYVIGSSFYAVPWDSRATASISNRESFAELSQSVGCLKPQGNVDPWAYGTACGPERDGAPNETGELAIVPQVHFGVLLDNPGDAGSHINGDNTWLVGNSSHCPNSLTVTMNWNIGTAVNPSPKPATKDAPRLGVTKIASVQWMTTAATSHQFSNPSYWKAELGKLEAHGDGYRVFPESLSPSQNIPNNKVHAKVTLVATVPSGMRGTVHLKVFDPDNPLVLDKNDPAGDNQNRPNDNYGELVNWYNELTFDSSIPKAHSSHDSNTAKIRYYYGAVAGAHAGDNYILATHPNEGITEKYQFATDGKALTRPTTTLPTALRSSVLTVWRTLNVECDVAAWPGMPSGVSLPLGGIVATELARACVVTVPYTTTVTAAPNISNPMSQTEFNLIRGGVGTGSGRDIYGNSPDFWTVRIVMASAFGGAAGGFTPNTNTVVLRYETIKSEVDSWNTNHGTETVTINSFIEKTILHEICHLLIDGSERHVYFSTIDTTTSVKSTIGVRDTIWRNSTPKAENSQPGAGDVADMYNHVLYVRLLENDIREIQQHSRARS